MKEEEFIRHIEEGYQLIPVSKAIDNLNLDPIDVYEKNLENKNMIRKPIMLHFAENDGFVPAETRKGLEESFSDNDLVTINNYSGCDHGFARTGGSNYDKAAAEISDTRTLALLKKSLT